MINNFGLPQLQVHFNNQFDGVFQRLYWFQIGAPVHRLKAVKHMLYGMFANRAVTLYHEVEWPPISLDLTACDFLLWVTWNHKFLLPLHAACRIYEIEFRLNLKFWGKVQVWYAVLLEVRKKGHKFVLKNMTDVSNKNLQK